MVIEMAIKYLVLAIAMIAALNSDTSFALDTLHLGDSLAGNETIISNNGTFELGFFSPNGTNNWYVGIWYSGMSPKVVVWVANRDNPVKGMPGVLNFSSDGHLRLFDISGRSVWSSDPGLNGTRARIMESGNFIMLGDGQNKSEIVWESFAHPGDTWLPGMKFWSGMKITSWKSSVDPASGLFSLVPEISQGKAQLMLFYNNTVPYSSSGEWTGSYFTNVPAEEIYYKIKYNFSCVMVSPSSFYFQMILIPFGNIVRGREKVENNGEIKVYFGGEDGRWSEAWSTYGGQCNEYDICGAYGLCNGNAVCSCIEGFKPKNDSQGWLSSGCARRIPLQCSATAGTTDGFLESKNRSMSDERAVSYNNEPTMEGCRTSCLKNCSCTAYSFVISGPRAPFCRLWFGDLFKMSVSSDSQSIFIRLAASELPISTTKGSRKSPALFISLPSAAAFSTALLLVLLIRWKRRRQRKRNVDEDMPLFLKMFSYKELRIATGNFKHKLGRGAFGSVFEGTLPDSTLVAVKRLEGSAGADKQFRAEINTIGNLQHVNLVRLYGFCVEGTQRLLVYSYMPNGSLNSSLFCEGEAAEKVLDWKTRFQIALGTARGLVYLHEKCKDQIIHCDIKPENILLDGDLNPKIADFGLAKLVGRDFSRVLTTTRGTPGYLAPEWLSGLPITPKVDVYSFGMMLMEIISGRRNLDLTVEERSRLYFPTWASSQVEKGNTIGMVDARIASETNVEEARRAAIVAGLCIQENEERRPSMGEVVKMLEGTLETPAPQIPRSLQEMVEEDDKRDIFGQHACI